ncbi:ataxin-7 isoform X2 [Hemicordylus capensis]|uniref:ataxin-7 isoform X2 n=1 Tax=Hemicordylus capensis TaxID=884348 RepID=UPI0023030D8F|nr:ataxin-7 isoform X2 [Hemicordylus capensis]
MSARAVVDVRGEQRRAAAAAAASRQQRRPRHGGGGSAGESGPGPGPGPASTAPATSAAMATVGERRSLPSPEAMLGQPWSLWVDAAKLHGNDGAALEESFKEYGKNREAMRLCREDMPIFGLYPAHDDFYLVMCNHCNQVVKPQAFQSHYERRHSSANKPPLTSPSPSVFSLFSSLSSKSKGSSGGGSSRPSSGGGGGTSASSSSSTKLSKSSKDKVQISGNKSVHLVHSKGPHEKIMPPSVKVEKIHPKIDGPTCSTTVSSSIKTGLNPSIPKPPLPSPGQILNGKGLLSVPPYLEKKHDETTNNRKFLHTRLSQREFDPDIYCGVIDVETKKPCTRSLTCKTHSLTQRRAVQGRRKRFDLLLAEHKSKTRDKELLRHLDHHQQIPPLREPHPSPSRTSQELHQNSHGVIPTESKPLVPNKPKPHTPSLPRPPGCPAQHSGNAPSESSTVHESPHAPLPAADPASRLSSDEGECDEKEEPVEKLDCLYSDHHPQPAAFCTFGSRQIGRGYYVFDKRWNHIRCALNVMVDKHLNSQMWKKIPPASSNTASIRAPHRTNSTPVSQYSTSTTGFLLPTTTMSSPVLMTPSCLSLSGKSVPSHGTTLNANPASFGAAEPVCNMQSRQVSSSPSTPPVLSSVSSPLSSKPQKLKSSKSFKPKEPSASSANCNSSNSSGGSSGKKRKNGSALPAPSSHSTESFRKNCVVNSGNSGASYHSSVMSSSHSVGLNCMTSKANSVSLKHDQSGRGPPTGSPAESIKRMSVMVNSGDSTLSLGPFIHQSSELTVNSHSGFSHSHPSLEKFIGKKRKCSPGSSSINSSSKANKVAKLPPVNNIHTKHTGAIPGTQGLMNNSILHQV